MKTETIELTDIKCHDWYAVGMGLGLSEKKIDDVFEYGEFGSIEIIIDENLNIVGGRIIPFKK